MTCVPETLDHGSGGGMSGDERDEKEEDRIIAVHLAVESLALWAVYLG